MELIHAGELLPGQQVVKVGGQFVRPFPVAEVIVHEAEPVTWTTTYPLTGEPVRKPTAWKATLIGGSQPIALTTGTCVGVAA